MYEVDILGEHLALETAPSLFSPGGLDAGTRALLNAVEAVPGGKVLDLGCGCGVLGICLAKKLGEGAVTMCDIDPVAVRVARENAEKNGVPGVRVILSNGFESIPDAEYTHILSNPPYHSDFSVAKHFIEKGFNRLALGGTLALVVKRQAWYKNKLAAIFGGVKIVQDGEYSVLIAEKRSARYANKR